MHITVNICTWNRADLLDQTLESMTHLKISSEHTWELIVVNNNCSDHTDLIIEKHKSRLPIIHLWESTPGKSYALNSALKSANGQLILFTDDDVLVQADWITRYITTAESHPDHAAFGGTVRPLYQGRPPKWVARNISDLQDVFALRLHTESTREPSDSESFVGANMAIRKEYLRNLQFNTELGRAGENNIRGEETELMKRMRQQGHKFLWVANAGVDHFVPTQRMSTRYIWDWYFGIGQAMAIQAKKDGAIEYRWMYRKHLEARVRMASRFFQRDHRWIDHLKTAAKTLGMISETKKRLVN